MERTELKAAPTITRTFRGRKRERGFTLIELGVVILILILFSALTVPSIVNEQRSRDANLFIGALPRFASQAREAAINRQRTVKLVYDESQSQLQMIEEALPSNVQAPINTFNPNDNTKNRQQDPSDQETTLGTLQVPYGVSVRDFQLKGDASSAADWQLEFFTDGKSLGGGLEVDDAGRAWSLTVSKYGIIELQQGNLPQQPENQWTAGDYEHRQ